MLLLTFDLNRGPFNNAGVVMMVASRHGNMALCALTAVAGAGAVLLISRHSPPGKWLLFLGRNTLILFGLNGILHAFVNRPMAQKLGPLIPDSSLWVTGLCGLLTAASLALLVPVVLVVSKHRDRRQRRAEQGGLAACPLAQKP